ncbi:MAG: phosphatase PAP2 family protein [Myxococcales bacterium]|nr:phosphatase PAP2 family protein [Myxococcales bacterium]
MTTPNLRASGPALVVAVLVSAPAAVAFGQAVEPAGATTPTAAIPQPAPVASTGWWSTRDLVDYGIVAGSLGGFYAIHSLTPSAQSGIGPSFDAAHPAAILKAEFADQTGRKHLIEDKGETVPAAYVGAALPLVAAWLGLQEGLAANSDARHLHDVLVGLGDSMATTLFVTEILKYEFGRLRPDFQDRVRRHYCTTQKSVEISCTGAEVPLDADPAKADKVFADGRRSFPSGHSSTSFVLATYAGLVTGGHLVWGERATPTTRMVGIALQATVLGLAGFVVWSRVDDGRHNPTDVLAGSLIGVAMANVAYWRRFTSSGTSRRAVRGEPGVQVSLAPGPVPAGMGFTVRF